tara:strand:- start:514 stop:696 length:183 start_codon:yes stop_codon:yes gene_type:complete
MKNLQITFTQEELENLKHILFMLEIMGGIPKGTLDKYDLDGDKVRAISDAIDSQIIYCVK